MNDSELKKIKDRCDKAKSGPWISYIEGRDHTCGSNFIATEGDDIELTGATIEDQDFIAAARTDVPALIEEIYRLRKLLEEHNIEY